jgi:tetratricopeptide (TPR) repeat protein
MTRVRLARHCGAAVAGLAIFLGSFGPAAAHDDLHGRIADATREIAAQPGTAALYLKRGELYRLHRAWSLAARDYDSALRLAPTLSAVHFARGRMLLESGRPLEAKRSLDTFLATDPDNVSALVERARVQVRLGRVREGAGDFGRAIGLLAKPEPEYYAERARALADAGQLDEAIGGLDESRAKLGSIVALELQALELERGAGRYDGALARVDAMVARSARKEGWLVLRGDILKEAGRADEARRAYEAALEAIAALPEHRRSVRAVRDLEARARREVRRP